MDGPAVADRELLRHSDEQATGHDWVTATLERAGGCLVIRLAGDIDHLSAGLLRELVISAIESAGRWRVVLDLERVPFCDSAGLGALVSIWQTVQAHGGAFALARVPPGCDLALAVTGLRKVLGSWDSVADAITSVSAV